MRGISVLIWRVARISSALLSLAFCILWVRSYFVVDHWCMLRGTLYRHSVRDWHQLSSNSGSLSFSISWGRWPRKFDATQRPWRFWWDRLEPSTFPGPRHSAKRLGLFAFKNWGEKVPKSTFWETWDLTVPHWAIALPLALPAAFSGVGFLRKRRRRKRGVCMCCGYDLRASAERCPECGTPVPAEKRGNESIERNKAP